LLLPLFVVVALVGGLVTVIATARVVSSQPTA